VKGFWQKNLPSPTPGGGVGKAEKKKLVKKKHEHFTRGKGKLLPPNSISGKKADPIYTGRGLHAANRGRATEPLNG